MQMTVGNTKAVIATCIGNADVNPDHHLSCKILTGALLAIACCKAAAIWVSPPTGEGKSFASSSVWQPATMPLYLALRFKACTPAGTDHVVDACYLTHSIDGMS